jgi:hypothetical protein
MSAWQRKQAGQALSRDDENLINARFDAERQTTENKGTIQKSLFPDKKPAPTAQQQARGETQYAADYSKERAATMARNGIAPAAAVTAGGVAATGLNDGIKQMAAPQGVRKTKVTNAAIDDVKSEDNMQGPHLGADGQPATWKLPAGDIGGRYGGQDIQKPLPGAKGVPDGYGVMQGGDGTWRISGPGGLLTDEKGQRRSFKDMYEVQAYFALAGGGADGAAAGDAKMREDEAEIQAMRNAADSTPGASPPAAVTAAPAVQAAAVKMAQQPQAPVYNPMTQSAFGVPMNMPQATPSAAPTLPSAEAVSAAQPAPGTGDGMNAMLQSAMAQKPAWPASAAPIPPAVSPPPRDAAAAAPPSQPDPGDTAFGPNPVTNFVRRAFNAVASPELDPRVVGTKPRESLPAMAGPLAAPKPQAPAPVIDTSGQGIPEDQWWGRKNPNPAKAINLPEEPIGNVTGTGPFAGPAKQWGRQMQTAPAQYQTAAEQPYNPLRKRRTTVLPA